MSPLLFAVVVDVLLRKLTLAMNGQGTVRAFADDTAAVLDNLFGFLPTVAQLFDEYAAISGLHLNYGKTVLVPLWRREEREYEEIDRMLAAIGGGWVQVLVRSMAKYLGFLVGPGRDDSIWDKPVTKWRLRARGWQGTHVGLQYSALVYNVFCASVLYFIAQLEPIPVEVHAQEEATMLVLASGPTAWANSSDLWRMGAQCGVGRSFHCIKARGEASMLRAYYFENWERPIREEVARLATWERTSCQIDRQFFWRGWFERSYPRTLHRNQLVLAERGIRLQDIRTKLCPGRNAAKDRAKLRAGFQREAARANLQAYLETWEYRIDHKLVRWELQGNRHRHRNLLINNLQRLGKLVPPRVAAASWGLVWNRWCTARRFQGEAPCMLGCGRGKDSIEHYMGCRVGREAGGRMLRLGGNYARRKQCLLGVIKFDDDSEQTCWAVLAYGLYMTTNARRASRMQARPLEEAVQEVMQHCRQAVEGDPRAKRCLSQRWAAR